MGGFFVSSRPKPVLTSARSRAVRILYDEGAGNGCSQPIAAGRQPLGAVIRTTAVLRKLPEGQFTLLGQSGRWRFDPTASAMDPLPQSGYFRTVTD